MTRHLRALPLAAALAVGALAAPAAHAAPEPVNSGQIDWGVKQSFRNYVTGPIAHGQVTTAGSATVNANGTYRFPVQSGSYDPEAGTTTVSSAGSVRFTGHDGMLDFTLSDIRVVLDGTAPRLIADAQSKDMNTGQMTQYDDTEFADLNPTGITPVTTGDDTTWSAIPAVLTAAGVPAFASFYPAGTALDPVTVTHSPVGSPVLEEPPPAPTPVAPSPASTGTTVTPAGRRTMATLSLGRLSKGQRRLLARGQMVVSRLRVSGPGRVTLTARGRIGNRQRVLARAAKTSRAAGVVQLRWRLSKAARAQLKREGALRVRLTATLPGAAKAASYAVTLQR